MLCGVRVEKAEERHLEKLLDFRGKLRLPWTVSTNSDPSYSALLEDQTLL